MNIDLTQEDLDLLINLLDDNASSVENSQKAADLRLKLSRHLQRKGHSPETEIKEGIVDTSKNKDWKAP
jgi:hypothetical protein